MVGRVSDKDELSQTKSGQCATGSGCQPRLVARLKSIREEKIMSIITFLAIT